MFNFILNFIGLQTFSARNKVRRRGPSTGNFYFFFILIICHFLIGSHSPGTGVGLGQANGGTFANAQGQAQTIPIGPFGGRITLAESTSLAAGIPGLGGSSH